MTCSLIKEVTIKQTRRFDPVYNLLKYFLVQTRTVFVYEYLGYRIHTSYDIKNLCIHTSILFDIAMLFYLRYRQSLDTNHGTGHDVTRNFISFEYANLTNYRGHAAMQFL